MDCSQAENLATLVLIDDPAISVADRVAFDLHLQACTSCREAFAESRRVMGMVREYGKLSTDTVEILESQGYEVADQLRPEPREEITLSEDEIESGLASLMAKIDEIEVESDSETDELAPMSLEDGVADLRRRVNTLEAQQDHWREQWVEEEDHGDTWDSVTSCTTNHTSGQSDITKTPSSKRTGRIAVSLAMAACLAILAMVWFVYQPVQLTTQSQSIAQNNQATLELITETGRQQIGLDSPIRSQDGIMELLLGSKHKVVLNRNTTATVIVKPRGNGKSPEWRIELQSGELYAEVVPNLTGDTKFSVTTPNALATITGTKFNIRAQDQLTELTLLKGSVRFAQLGDVNPINVTTGHASTITGRLAPSTPSPVDALVKTAWARETALDNALASAQQKADSDLEGLMITSENFRWQANLPDVDTLDYESWRNANRQSRIAQTALAALPKDKAANADWIEVLMVSGSIWQFQFDPNRPIDLPCAKIEQANITFLARYTGLDKQSILKALGLTESVLVTPNHQDKPLGLQYVDALQRWHDAVSISQSDKPEALSDVKLFSLLVSQYLAQTRTAAYLWVKYHPETAQRLLTDKTYLTMLPTQPTSAVKGAPDVEDWLKQLHDQANAARYCVPVAMEWLLASPEIECTAQASKNHHQRLSEWVSCLVALDGQSSSP